MAALGLVLLLLAQNLLAQVRVTRSLATQEQTLAALNSQIAALDKRLVEGETARSALAARVAGLEADAASQVDLSQLSKEALGSVFTIEVHTPLGGALGSAWVASSTDGRSTLVTNFHVIEQAWAIGQRQVKVRQGDLTYDGTIVDVSESEDLAAVEVMAHLEPLAVDRAKPSVGDQILVIGSPYGLEGTVATGIISAFRAGRVQFSAPVSPGDSGGPILDADGHVIAVTVEKIVASGAEGLSFGIPISVACRTVITC